MCPLFGGFNVLYGRAGTHTIIFPIHFYLEKFSIPISQFPFNLILQLDLPAGHTQTQC